MLRAAILILLFIITASTVTFQVAQTPRYGYVFSPDQRYVVVDLTAGTIAGSGTIPEVIPGRYGLASPFDEKVLLYGIDPAQKNAPEPRSQLAVLNAVRTATGVRLSFARWLPGPTDSASVISASVLGGNLLTVSSGDERVQTRIYDATLNPVKTLDGLLVRPTTCLSSDSQTIYAVAQSSERKIQIGNLRSLEVSESSYASIGNPDAFYKAPIAADGCVVAFIERMNKATAGSMPATIYLRDVEKKTTLNSFAVAGDGRFALVLKRKLLLHDLTELAPNKLPDGSTVGVRRMSPGTLILYDTTSGKETGRITVPPDGALADVSTDGAFAYYLSPNLLSVVDLINRRVASKIALPFRYGTFVAASEKQAKPAVQPQSPPSNRRGPCGCYACGVLLAVDFPNKSPECAGILATDACPQELAQMPDKGVAFCKEIQRRSKNRSFAGCRALESYCNSLSQD